MNDAIRIAFSTFPEATTARGIAEQLVNEKLAACANILPQVESIYRWQGKLEQSIETLALFKVSSDTYADFEVRLKSLHPYEVPEIVAIDVAAGLPEYVRWVSEGCTPL